MATVASSVARRLEAPFLNDLSDREVLRSKVISWLSWSPLPAGSAVIVLAFGSRLNKRPDPKTISFCSSDLKLLFLLARLVET